MAGLDPLLGAAEDAGNAVGVTGQPAAQPGGDPPGPAAAHHFQLDVF
jgi:hypothetical protein